MSIMMNNTAAFIPQNTQQFLGGGLFQGLSSLAGQSTPNTFLSGGFQPLQGNFPTDKTNNPFNVLDPSMMYNIDPMYAVNLATAIGGLPMQQTTSDPADIFSPGMLNNISPMDAIALAQAIVGPILSQQPTGMLA